MAKEIDEFSLYEDLKTLECPFDWGFPEYIFSTKEVIETKMQNLDNKINSETEKLLSHEFQWRKFVFTTSLSFYYFKVDKKDQAWQTVEKAYAIIDAEGIRDSFYESIKASLFHIILAMKARYYFDDGEYFKAQEVVQMIKRRESMSNIEKAGLLGLKVSIFNEYGPDSSAFVVDDIREAVSLNPEEAEWHFLLGKVLRRLRKLGTFFEIPEKEEICALENAYSKKKCPAYAIFCATSYKELSTKLFQKFGPENFGEQIKGLNGKALELYREALQYDDLSATALSKISRGLSELPYPFKDLKKALELALKAVELCPNSPLTLHTLAMFYERHEMNFEKALEFNLKSYENGSYGSGMDIIKINMRLNPEYNPLPILNELKEKFHGKGHLDETTLQEACYYLILKQDLDQALDIFMNLIKNSPDLHGLRVCKPMWLFLKKPISIYELLYHELKSLRNKNKSTAYMDALLKIKQNAPDLFKKEVDENFLANLKEESEINYKRYAKKTPTSARHSDPRGQRFDPGASRGRHNRSEDNNWRNKSNFRNSEGDSRHEHNQNNYITNRNNTYDKRFNNRRTQFGNQSKEIKSIDRNRTVKSRTDLPENEKSSSWRFSNNSENVSQEKIKSQELTPTHETSLEKNVISNTADIKNQSQNILKKSIPSNPDVQESNASLIDSGEKDITNLPCKNSVLLTTSDSNVKSNSDHIDSQNSSDENSNNEDQSDEENYKKKFNQQKILENMKLLKERLKQKPKTENKTYSVPTVNQQLADATIEEEQHESKKIEQSLNTIGNINTQIIEKSSVPSESITNPQPYNVNVPCDPIANTDEDVMDKFSQLAIQEQLNTVDQSTVEPKQNTQSETENNTDQLADKLNHLNKNEIKLLLKMVTKKTEKKKKKTKKIDIAINQETEAVDGDLLPPPKLIVVTAGNQAIRQPKGPTENNFSLLRKK